MSGSFEIASSVGSYTVRVGGGLFDEILAQDDLIVVCDEIFADQARAKTSRVLPVLAREESKSIESVADVIIQLRELGATRSTTILALGGGIVQDLAAFVASIYMRGLQWIYMPTTMLSMVDSCIGGKSSINVGRYKNIVGTFRPPDAVLIDPSFLDRLALKHHIEGLIEAAKICFARGHDEYRAYAALEAFKNPTPQIVEALIVRSLLAKKYFIEIDEFDRGERLLLNFGHTFGHAIESASHFRVSHGVAVGLGMLCALEFERRQGMDYSTMPIVAELEAHLLELLALVDGLDASLKDVTGAAAFDAFCADKKHERDVYVVVVVDERGALQRRKVAKTLAMNLHISEIFSGVLGRAFR